MTEQDEQMANLLRMRGWRVEPPADEPFLCRHGWHKWIYPLRPVGEHGPRRECLRCGRTEGQT